MEGNLGKARAMVEKQMSGMHKGEGVKRTKSTESCVVLVLERQGFSYYFGIEPDGYEGSAE